MRTHSSGRALAIAATSWFVVALSGQLLFAFSVAAFYGLSAGRGQWQSWNRFMSHGYVTGDGAGNGAVAVHLLCATLLVVSGGLQLVPAVRARWPALHRWNGRIYLVCAVLASVAGLAMMWGRGTVGDLAQHLVTSLNAVLAIGFAAMTLRAALARDFVRHRRWALRLYVVVLGVWFVRVMFTLWLAAFGGPFGFDPTTFTGPALIGIGLASYLLPLAVVELYWRAGASRSRPWRAVTAGVLAVSALAVGFGAAGAALGTWLPATRAAFDPRTPISGVLVEAMSDGRVDAAVQRYRELKSTSPTVYNFDEPELNRLGYTLMRDRKLAAAIRVFTLNVEAYPRSSNVHDSLGEALAASGDVAGAIASYKRAVALDPTNRGAAAMLVKLQAR